VINSHNPNEGVFCKISMPGTAIRRGIVPDGRGPSPQRVADGLAEPVEGSDPAGELGGDDAVAGSGDSLALSVSSATSRCRRRRARW
jgi:hypothetical protein